MTKPRLVASICLASWLGLWIAARPALATPYVDITADWAVDSFTSVLTGGPAGWPAGLVISCFGGATGGGAAGCSDSLTLDQTVTVSQDLSATAMSGLTIANHGTTPLDGNLAFVFSTFDPLASLGIGVDSLSDEASFVAAISGPGVDATSPCSLGEGPPMGCVLLDGGGGARARYTEAVWSPDSSLIGISLALAPGDSENLSYTISIDADFAVPEPSSLPLLGGGLLLLALVYPLTRFPLARRRGASRRTP